MIEKEHPAISIRRQSELLGISRSAVYYQPGKVRDEHDIEELQEILKVLEVIPFYGYRKVVLELRKQGTISTRKRVRRIMRKFGLRAIFSKPNLSKARKEHKKYPYLLSGKVIRYPNQVWASDLARISHRLSFCQSFESTAVCLELWLCSVEFNCRQLATQLTK
jgi:putative transposase